MRQQIPNKQRINKNQKQRTKIIYAISALWPMPFRRGLAFRITQLYLYFFYFYLRLNKKSKTDVVLINMNSARIKPVMPQNQIMPSRQITRQIQSNTIAAKTSHHSEINKLM